jgi:hypothetical protein
VLGKITTFEKTFYYFLIFKFICFSLSAQPEPPNRGLSLPSHQDVINKIEKDMVSAFAGEHFELNMIPSLNQAIESKWGHYFRPKEKKAEVADFSNLHIVLGGVSTFKSSTKKFRESVQAFGGLSLSSLFWQNWGGAIVIRKKAKKSNSKWSLFLGPFMKFNVLRHSDFQVSFGPFYILGNRHRFLSFQYWKVGLTYELPIKSANGPRFLFFAESFIKGKDFLTPKVITGGLALSFPFMS